MIRKYKWLVFSMLPFWCLAGCNKEDHYCRLTNLGVLKSTTKAMSSDGYSHLTLNNVGIYKSSAGYISLIYDDMGFMKNKKYYITKTIIETIPKIPCHHKEFKGFCIVSVVLDFSGDKLIISNEFISDTGQDNVDWVSWGKANSIIVFTDGSKFKYENGRVERVVNQK